MRFVCADYSDLEPAPSLDLAVPIQERRGKDGSKFDMEKLYVQRYLVQAMSINDMYFHGNHLGHSSQFASVPYSATTCSAL